MMKLQLKPLILSISLSTFGLCGIVAAASPNSPVDNKVKIIRQIVKVYTMPGKPERNSNQELNLVSFAQLLSSPILNIPMNQQPDFSVKPLEKKNQLFEMANIFNDKLQRIMSVFSTNKAKEFSFNDMVKSDCKTEQNL